MVVVAVQFISFGREGICQRDTMGLQEGDADMIEL